jgi:osmotically-inducible protein OsmY
MTPGTSVEERGAPGAPSPNIGTRRRIRLMATTGAKSDPQIQQDVLRELKWDPRVEETEVGVEVDRGVVTLTGTVSGWAKKVAAEEAAHRVYGVLDVANDIVVKTPGGMPLTDTEIAQAVRRALEWDVFVPEERITSTVSNGWVTLAGTVDLWSDRESAERAIRNLQGVRGVTNTMTVTPSKVSSLDVRTAIEEALERRAEREAKKIQVYVTEGTVRLTGTVQSWQEKEAVASAARFTPGVRSVDNQLRIAA